MNNFLTQLRNDLRLNKRTLLTPIVLFIILDILAIAGYFIFKHHSGLTSDEIITFQFNNEISRTAGDFGRFIWTIIGMGTVGFAGLVIVIVSISIGNSALNLDYFRKCEIFYRSQPVNVWHYAGSKFLVTILAPTGIMIMVGIFNLILVIPFLIPYFGFEFLSSLHGMFSTVLLFFRSILILGSISFLSSAIFKEKAFIKLLLFLISIQVLSVFTHFSFDLPLLDVFGYLGKLINPLQNFKDLAGFGDMETMPEIYGFLSLENLMFNWHSLIQFVASVFFFISGVYIYRAREVS